MSKIIRTFEDRMACNVVQTSDGKYYYIDSTDTFDVGYETMVFACNKNGNHIDFCDLYDFASRKPRCFSRGELQPGRK